MIEEFYLFLPIQNFIKPFSLSILFCPFCQLNIFSFAEALQWTWTLVMNWGWKQENFSNRLTIKVAGCSKLSKDGIYEIIKEAKIAPKYYKNAKNTKMIDVAKVAKITK